MKNTFFIILLFIIFKINVAQKTNLEVANWKKLSQNSLALNDLNTFILSNQYLCIIDSKNDSLYNKNILYGYFENKQYESCFLLSKKLCEVDKQNIVYLDFYARSSESLKRYGNAVEAYEKLYLYTNKTVYGYLFANVQFYLARYKEAIQTIQILKTNKNCANEYLDFNLINSVKTQSVPVSVALLNLEGILYYEMKDIDTSKKSFLDAIEQFPEFQVAKENLKIYH